jgi:hypothetical protein
MTNPFRLVDKNAQNPSPAAAKQLNLDKLEPFTGADPLRYFLHFSRNILAIHCSKPNKKVGFRPLHLLDSYL